MTIYQLDPSTKTYVKIDMKEMEKNMGPMAKMHEETKVTATGETKTIEGFKCEKYILTIMGIENLQWLSPRTCPVTTNTKRSAEKSCGIPAVQKNGAFRKAFGKRISRKDGNRCHGDDHHHNA
jgi:hypothetical protein